MQVLSRADWQSRSDAHRERAERWTVPHLQRRDEGRSHPVEDFLFEYYNLSPGRLARWHPGLGVGLADAPEYAALGAYTTTGHVSAVDASRLDRRRPGLLWTVELLRRTAGRAPRWNCFGLHEWAMVYRAGDARRHVRQPLRLGQDGTDAVVESHQLACTHVDAFRFFTPEAVPRNPVRLERSIQLDHEQPGCLHVTMDLYRIAFRLLPFVEAGVVLDTFALARDVREVDMRASPYDLRDLGHAPIEVETAAGKAEYVEHQRRFTERAAPLRAYLLAQVESLLSSP